MWDGVLCFWSLSTVFYQLFLYMNKRLLAFSFGLFMFKTLLRQRWWKCRKMQTRSVIVSWHTETREKRNEIKRNELTRKKRKTRKWREGGLDPATAAPCRREPAECFQLSATIFMWLDWLRTAAAGSSPRAVSPPCFYSLLSLYATIVNFQRKIFHEKGKIYISKTSKHSLKLHFPGVKVSKDKVNILCSAFIYVS